MARQIWFFLDVLTEHITCRAWRSATDRPYTNFMNIHLNGVRRKTAADLTLASLVSELSLTGKRLAIEVNEEVVPRSHYEGFCLREGDKVEIVHAIGGG